VSAIQHAPTCARHDKSDKVLGGVYCDCDALMRANAVLSKINDIRNSVVGTQTVNWSEHIYPLVAALEDSGIAGMPYPEALENFGTLIERTNAAESALAALREEDERLHRLIESLADRMESVGAVEAAEALRAGVAQIKSAALATSKTEG